ncbi:MAG TPA: hypothetical protein VFX60_19290 [Micromonospora sp.]|nr:hypothetical protein [Micromonospora sp.]
MTTSGLYTYHFLPLKLIRPDDQIKSADGRSWLAPVTFVEYRPPCWTRVWWTTRPRPGISCSPPDWERPNDTKVRIRRPRPNHDATREEIAAEFARHGCKVESVDQTDLRITKASSGRRRSALLYFYADTGTFSGAHIGSQHVRSIDVVRRHFTVPTYH